MPHSDNTNNHQSYAQIPSEQLCMLHILQNPYRYDSVHNILHPSLHQYFLPSLSEACEYTLLPDHARMYTGTVTLLHHSAYNGIPLPLPSCVLKSVNRSYPFLQTLYYLHGLRYIQSVLLQPLPCHPPCQPVSDTMIWLFLYQPG